MTTRLNRDSVYRPSRAFLRHVLSILASLRFVLLSWIPLLGIVLALQMNSWRGPFYTQPDPAYIYLFNSLRMVDGHPPHHVEYPGTPEYALGALLIWTKYHLSPESPAADLVTEVLKSPEGYLDLLHGVLLILFALSSYGIGCLVFILSGSLALAVLTQASVFGFTVVNQALAYINAQSLLITIGLCLVSLLILYEKRQGDKRVLNVFPILQGVLIALGIATKLTFFPWVLSLAFLRTRKERLIGAAAALVSFLALVYPIRSRLIGMLGWIKRLVSHTGFYGEGQGALPSVAEFFNGMGRLVAAEPLFFAMLMALFFARWRLPEHKRLFTVSIAIIVAQFIMTIRAPHARYLLPSLLVAPWVLASSWISFAGKRKMVIRTAAILLALSTGPLLWNFSLWKQRQDDVRETTARVSHLLLHETRCAPISFHGDSRLPYAPFSWQ
jgi:hypothetical protein